VLKSVKGAELIAGAGVINIMDINKYIFGLDHYIFILSEQVRGGRQERHPRLVRTMGPRGCPTNRTKNTEPREQFISAVGI